MSTFTPAAMTEMLPFAIDALARASVLLLLALGSAHLLRRSSAALRHLVWTLAIIGSVALPFLTAAVPFRIHVLPATSTASQVTEDDQSASDNRIAASEAATPEFAGALESPAMVSESSTAGEENPLSAPGRFNVAGVLAAIWLTGTLLFIARFLAGLTVVRRIARDAEPAETEWRRLGDRAARVLGVRSSPEIRLTDEVAMPFACGLVKPVIVLPASANEWSAERREAVLMHEVAHISRGDLMMNAMSHIVRALYWFNPLAWVAAYRLRVEGERACDDQVLRAGALASDYAEHLLSIVRTVGRSVPSAALAMARPSDFEGRLLAILDAGLPRFPMTRWRAAGIAGAFLAIVTPLAAMSPTEATPDATIGGESAALVQASPSAAARPVADTAAQTRETSGAGRQAGQAGGAVGALIEALGDGSAAVRMAAVNSLGALGDPRAIAALARALKEDTDARVREAAAHALGEIDDPRAVPHLMEALKAERVADVREQIVRALGEIGDPAAASGIAAVLKDASVKVRRAAVDAIDDLEDRSVIPALVALTGDEDAEVRRLTAEALGNLEATSAIDALVTLTRDSDSEVRSRALSSLGDLDDHRALPAMVAALKDKEEEVRNHAADAIGNLDELDKAPAGLIEALSDPSADVRQSVANALGNIEDQAAVPALKRATADMDTEVRRSAVEALSQIGGAEAIEALLGLLKDRDPEIRRRAAEALGNKP